MATASVSFQQLGAASKHPARRRLTVGESRLELLTMEVQVERERLLHAFRPAFGLAAFGLRVGFALKAAA